MKLREGVAWAGCLLLCSCHQQQTEPAANKSEPVIQMTSSAFVDGGILPQKYTCEGSKVSPPLQWGPAPPAAKSIAITCEDPDAPGGTFTHWVLFNLPAIARGLPEAVPTTAKLAGGAVQGQNDFGSAGYGAPCPPSGIHRYIFKVYALDQPLALSDHTTRQDLLNAIERHIVAQGEVTARYGKTTQR